MASAGIESFHAHIYFSPGDETTTARAVVDEASREIGALVKIGRFHERPVGPHPRGSIQLHVEQANALTVLTWLMQHRDGLTVFVHGNTGDDYLDHTQHVAWLGDSEPLKLSVFSKS